ncbi:MAG TPA: hypothetical protein EYP20_01225 [Aigarchaeota archaeon]|nr:hypothetical protein [Aigarchaeota archaeon]
MASASRERPAATLARKTAAIMAAKAVAAPRRRANATHHRPAMPGRSSAPRHQLATMGPAFVLSWRL